MATPYATHVTRICPERTPRTNRSVDTPRGLAIRLCSPRFSRSASALALCLGDTPRTKFRLRALRTRAPAHLDTDTWGVSDPAGRPGATVAIARAGSLTPHPCCDTCAGALTGRHNAPPAPGGGAGATSAVQGLRRLGDRWSRWGGTRRDRRHCGRGPTAPWRSVPLLGPSGGGYLNGLTTRTPSKSSNPGRSSE